MWYHLSRSDSLEPAIVKLFRPKIAYGEPTKLRLPMAPTVSQCIYGTPSNGLLYIYEVEVANPVPAYKVSDAGTSQEHWVTREVLKKAKGSVPVHLVGRVEVTPELREILKRALHAKGVRFTAEEESALWDKRADGLWLPKFEQAKGIEVLLGRRAP